MTSERGLLLARRRSRGEDKDPACRRHVPDLDTPFAGGVQRLAVGVERQARDAFARRRAGQSEGRGEAALGHVPERHGRIAVARRGEPSCRRERMRGP